MISLNHTKIELATFRRREMILVVEGKTKEVYDTFNPLTDNGIYLIEEINTYCYVHIELYRPHQYFWSIAEDIRRDGHYHGRWARIYDKAYTVLCNPSIESVPDRYMI